MKAKTTMTKKIGPLGFSILIGLLLALLLLPTQSASSASERDTNRTIPPAAPILINDDFECADGYYEIEGPGGKPNRIPDGWHLVLLEGTPRLNSARIQFAKACDGQAHIERISGEDSFVALSWEIETPPLPGKPFDSTLYQQTQVFSASAYSLSGWFLTLCGGSALPNDCPDDFYMAKMLGMDPTGGIDPQAESVIWVENRDNFVDENDERIGWTNLYTTAVSQAMTMTVFARIDSPFQWHGNHGFIDAFSLIRAPLAEFVDLPAEAISDTVTLAWDGEQSPDVAGIPGGNYKLYFDVEVRHESDQSWKSLVTGIIDPGQVDFTAKCADSSYDFRVRGRAEQPEGEPGSSPNQRYPGPWSDISTVFFPAEPGGEPIEPLPVPLFIPYTPTEPVEC